MGSRNFQPNCQLGKKYKYMSFCVDFSLNVLEVLSTAVTLGHLKLARIEQLK